MSDRLIGSDNAAILPTLMPKRAARAALPPEAASVMQRPQQPSNRRDLSRGPVPTRSGDWRISKARGDVTSNSRFGIFLVSLAPRQSEILIDHGPVDNRGVEVLHDPVASSPSHLMAQLRRLNHFLQRTS